MWKTTPWFAVCLLLAAPAMEGHVGSPDVFYAGMAGPYRLFVTVRTPPMVPGIAEIEVNAVDGGVDKISVVALRVVGEGASNAPPPDMMRRSEGNSREFTGRLWLMASGSWQVRMEVSGKQGTAEMAVPVAAAARRSLQMQKALGGLLFALMAFLVLALISIIGAAAREGRLSAGEEVKAERRRWGRVGMTATAVALAAILFLGNKWWDAAAAERRDLMIYKAPPMEAVLVHQDTLELKPGFSAWHDRRKTTMLMDKIIPDHGHLLHAFLLRMPELDRFYHLHPERISDGAFAEKLPEIAAGQYQVFADIVRESGFADTMTAKLELPNLAGAAGNADDSGVVAAGIKESEPSLTALLTDGGRAEWERGGQRVAARTPTLLRFRILGRNGEPANDLEPYMGMAGHLVVVKRDLTVFAHLHPAGSVPMAAVMLLQSGHQGMTDMANGEPGRIGPEITFPYGFPESGKYRLFLQLRKGGKIVTAVFDVEVEE